jgi:ceramide glucosyltransferase
MMIGLGAAGGTLVAFGDSDTRPDRTVLRVLVETLLTTPGAGAAFAPVVVANPPVTVGDVGYALLINALYGSSVALVASATGDVPFIMGQLMVLRREALQAIGGLDAAEGQLVDDMHIGACLTAVGYRNIMSSHPLAIATGGMAIGDFLRLFRRWMLFSRSGLPRSFTWPEWLRGCEFWLAAVLIMLALASGHTGAAVVPALATLALGYSLMDLQVAFGGTRLRLRHAWVPLGIFLVGPLIFAATFVRRQVAWRGRTYALDPEARLA